MNSGLKEITTFISGAILLGIMGLLIIGGVGILFLEYSLKGEINSGTWTAALGLWSGAILLGVLIWFLYDWYREKNVEKDERVKKMWSNAASLSFFVLMLSVYAYKGYLIFTDREIPLHLFAFQVVGWSTYFIMYVIQKYFR